MNEKVRGGAEFGLILIEDAARLKAAIQKVEYGLTRFSETWGGSIVLMLGMAARAQLQHLENSAIDLARDANNLGITPEATGQAKPAQGMVAISFGVIRQKDYNPFIVALNELYARVESFRIKHAPGLSGEGHSDLHGLKTAAEAVKAISRAVRVHTGREIQAMLDGAGDDTDQIPQIPLGATAVDRITGFRGIVTARVSYLIGCDQVCLSPGLNQNGEVRKGEYFDVNRCHVDPSVPVVDLSAAVAGGPQAEAPAVRS